MVTWEQAYDLIGIRDFIYFISSPVIQDALLPIKLVFIAFFLFFLAAVFYFYLNSSYIHYKYFYGVADLLTWQPYGLKAMAKRWNQIQKRIVTGSETEYKLAIIEADDFLQESMEDKGFKGENFDELLADASKKMPGQFRNMVAEAHQIRNSIVHDADYKLTIDLAKRILADYENATKMLAM